MPTRFFAIAPCRKEPYDAQYPKVRGRRLVFVGVPCIGYSDNEPLRRRIHRTSSAPCMTRDSVWKSKVRSAPLQGTDADPHSSHLVSGKDSQLSCITQSRSATGLAAFMQGLCRREESSFRKCNLTQMCSGFWHRDKKQDAMGRFGTRPLNCVRLTIVILTVLL